MPQAPTPQKPVLPSNPRSALADSARVSTLDRPAAFGRLYASLLYDALLLAAVLLVETLLFLVIAQAFDPAWQRPLLQIWLVVLTFGYFVYCWMKSGQTLAMRTWRIRIVTFDGCPLTVRHALLRYLFAFISAALAGLGWAWALFDREHRFLHDKLAGTKIVTCDPEKPRAASASRPTTSS